MPTLRQGRLVRHYFLVSVIIICAGLTTSGLLEVYFSHQDNLEHFGLIQKEIATSTAFKIEQFVQETERTLRAATRSREIVRDGLSAGYKWELRRLLVNAPAVTEAVAFDVYGVQRAEARRLQPVSDEDDWNALTSTIEAIAKEGKSYFGPVYFADGTGPFMTIGVPIERFAGDVIGILRVEIDLKYVGQVISNVRVGKTGYVYLVTRDGQLIAHPDLSMVLQKRELRETKQLKVVSFSPSNDNAPNALMAHNLHGKKVFSSFALIPGLGWVVFAEQPVEEIYAPLYASVFRTSGAFLLALGVALLATLLVRRRVVLPLEKLRQGVERIRTGDLTARLEIGTGDEIETLADEFNQMAAHLREAYTGLERMVAERTQALTIANNKLAETSEHKSRFLANVNHELRTPLSSIIGYARLLRRETEGQISSLQRENLEDLMRNAERLLALIDSLLDFAKIEAGKMEVQLEQVRIDELVQSAVTTVEPMLNRNCVRLVRNIPANIAPLYTDREKLRQIILNLLGNAVKFTEQGEIRVSACQANGDFKLAVADTGIGIDKADTTRIFKEFDRGGLSNGGNFHGTGLGLAIVKSLVDFLGGSIAVESEAGKGSTFTVTLPVKGREADPV
ncbi:MAG TPA: sensor histidine kinase [Candidatus Binatia bacterium]